MWVFGTTCNSQVGHLLPGDSVLASCGWHCPTNFMEVVRRPSFSASKLSTSTSSRSLLGGLIDRKRPQIGDLQSAGWFTIASTGSYCSFSIFGSCSTGRSSAQEGQRRAEHLFLYAHQRATPTAPSGGAPALGQVPDRHARPPQPRWMRRKTLR